MSKVNRRAALGAVGAVAAAGVLSTAALALPAHRQGLSPSPELLAWRKTRAAYWCASDRMDEFVSEWLRDHPAGDFPNDGARWDALLADPRQKSLNANLSEAEDVLDACVAVIMARPIGAWHDVAELAEMVRGEMRWNPGEREEGDDNAADPQVVAVFAAIEMMAGGANV